MSTKYFIQMMAAALMLVGCAFDDPMEKSSWEKPDPNAPAPVRFSVSTESNSDYTRAENPIVAFDANEKIRVLVMPDDEVAYTPYDYTTKSSGQSNIALQAPDPQPYFPAGSGTTVDAYAYYPATASIGSGTPFSVADDQSSDAAYKASDLMMAENRTIT